MLVCRRQAFIPAPARSIWDLVGEPRRHPEWWPEVLEVQGSRFGRGCSYCQISRSGEGVEEMTLLIEHVEELKELLVRCRETGLFMRWRLTAAQQGTFVDAEFGLDPRESEPGSDFDADAARHRLRQWLHDSLDGLKSAATREPPSDATPLHAPRASERA